LERCLPELHLQDLANLFCGGNEYLAPIRPD
jgi:hypothetical protein